MLILYIFSSFFMSHYVVKTLAIESARWTVYELKKAFARLSVNEDVMLRPMMILRTLDSLCSSLTK